MKMKLFSRILSVGVLTILLSSFACCDNENAPTYLLDNDFKGHIVFPIGSYWIYTDEVGRKDSVLLYQLSIELIDSRKIHNYNYQLLKQNLSSSFHKDTLFWGSGTEKDRNSDTVIHEYSERFLSNVIVTNVQFFNNVKPGTQFTFSANNEVKYLEELESFTIDGVNYHNVRVFENLKMEDDRLPQKVYYAKNVGIIRKELFNGQVWNLKRYFINN
jgi:hypothetical protein